MKKSRSVRLTLAVALAAGSSGGLLLAAEELTTGTHRFTEVRNEIYLAQTTARVFNSNSLVIVSLVAVERMYQRMDDPQ